MSATWTLLAAVLPTFAIVVAGLWMRRSGKLTVEADQSLVRLTVNLLYPCLILSSLLNNRVVNEPVNLIWAPLLGVATVASGYGMAVLMARLLRLPPVPAREFSFVTGIFNYGYLAVPIAKLLYGLPTLGVLWLFTLGIEATFWTLGFMVLRGSSWKDGLRQILSPPIVAIFVGVVLNWLHVDTYIPKFLTNTVDLIGNCAIPIALVTIGATIYDFLADFNPRERWPVTLSAIVLRQWVLPLLFILAACTLPISAELKSVLVVMASMPCAMFPILVIKHEKGDVGMALRIVLWSSALAIVSIPLWLKFGMRAVGV